MDFAAYDFWIKPIGLLRIGTVLKENGYSVHLLDCLDRNHPMLLAYLRLREARSRADGTGHFFKTEIEKPDVIKWVPRKYSRYGLPFQIVQDYLFSIPEPDVILMTSGMTYWYPGVVEMIALLRTMWPVVPVVLGGIYATLMPDHAGTVSGADYVITGTGEKQCLNLVQELTGQETGDIDRSEDGYRRPLYNLYPKLFTAALLSSRGCPYQCPFCASKQLNETYHSYDPADVAEEVIDLNTRHFVKHFAFYDDALLFEKESHIIPLLREIVSHGPRAAFHTPNGIQPRMIDETVAGLMYSAGFMTIRLSYETGNPERQRSMGMKITDDDLKRAVKLLESAGFLRENLGAYVIMGLPGQPVAEVLSSIAFVMGLGIRVYLASFSPVPGTQSWQDAVASGLMKENIDPLLTNNSVFPLQKSRNGYDCLVKLGSLVSWGNQLILEKRKPFNESEFIDAMRTIEQNSSTEQG